MTLTLEAFDQGLATGKYAWPGGYEIHLAMSDGESLCFECATSEAPAIREAIAERDDSGWRGVAFDVQWEGAPMQCAHCNRDIESAYGDPESDKESGE